MKLRLKRTAITIPVVLSLVAGLTACAILPPRINLHEVEPTKISGVTIYNPGRPTIADQTIEIVDGQIAAIRNTTSDDPAPICKSCFAMPGLIDAHIHTPPRIAIGNQKLFSLLYLRYGVTSVRDLGQSDKSVASLAQKIRSGRIPGPRMYRCGPVLDGDPPGWPSAVVLKTVDEAKDTVRQLKHEGVDCIKVYNEISLEVFSAIREEAAAQDLPVIGHIPHALGLNGVQNFESQHLTGVPYVSASRPEIGTDFTSEDIANLSEADLIQALQISRQNGISFTPTLANHWRRLTASDPVKFPPTRGADHMPAFWDKAWQTVAGHPDGEKEIDLHIAADEKLREFVREAHLQDIDILAGTDTIMPWLIPGEALQSEITIFADLFDSNDRALAAATIVNGRHIDEGRIGELKVGAFADILLIPTDPREDLSEIDRWEFIIFDGQLVKRSDLDAAISRYDRHFNGRIYSMIMGWAVGGSAEEYSSK